MHFFVKPSVLLYHVTCVFYYIKWSIKISSAQVINDIKLKIFLGKNPLIYHLFCRSSWGSWKYLVYYNYSQNLKIKSTCLKRDFQTVWWIGKFSSSIVHTNTYFFSQFQSKYIKILLIIHMCQNAWFFGAFCSFINISPFICLYITRETQKN